MGVLVANLLQVAAAAVTILVMGRVLLSWIDPAGRSPAASFVTSATEPILAPVRRALPSTGPVDFSPFIVLLLLGVLWRLT